MGVLKPTWGGLGVGLDLQGWKQQDPRPSPLTGLRLCRKAQVPIGPRPEVLGLTGTPQPTCRRLPPSTLATLLLKNESKQSWPSPPLPEHLCLGRAHLDCCSLFQPKGNRACQNLEQRKLKGRERTRHTLSPGLLRGQQPHKHAAEKETEGQRGSTARKRLSWDVTLPLCRGSSVPPQSRPPPFLSFPAKGKCRPTGKRGRQLHFFHRKQGRQNYITKQVPKNDPLGN